MAFILTLMGICNMQATSSTSERHLVNLTKSVFSHLIMMTKESSQKRTLCHSTLNLGLQNSYNTIRYIYIFFSLADNISNGANPLYHIFFIKGFGQIEERLANFHLDCPSN